MLGYLAGFTRAKSPKSRVGNAAALKAWKIYYDAWNWQLVKKFSRDINRVRRMDAAARKKGKK